MTQNALPQRRLGSSSLEVSAIGLGCMSLTEAGKNVDYDPAIALIHAALDRGINFFDMANSYGDGDNEVLVGRALKGRRNEVVLATKFGNVVVDGKRGINGRPEHVTQACEESLRRLGTDRIDLYFQHRVDAKVPIEDTVGAMSRLVEKGKVRYIGLCEAHPETIRRGHSVHPITAVQSEYSLLYREHAEETLATTRDLGISFVAFSPLGRGFLTGAINTISDIDDPRRREHPRFQGDNFAHNRELVARLEAIAAQKTCTPGQLSLAWLLAQGQDVVPIPGTRNLARLVENIAAYEVELSAEDVGTISETIPKGAAAGLRHPNMTAVYI